MDEVRTLLERTRGHFPAPELPLEGVLRRHERRRRNQRIAAGAVGLAVAAAAVLIGTNIVRSSPDQGERPGSSRTVTTPLPAMSNGPIDVVGFTGGVRTLTRDGLGPFEVRCSGSCTEVRDADWSPDGRVLAFAPGCGGGCASSGDPYHGIRVFDPATGEDRLVLPGGYNGLAWSPDGSQFAYVTEGPQSMLGVAGSDGSAPTTIASVALGTTMDVSPSWSPDGRQLAVIDGDSIVRIGADGSSPTTLTDGTNPAWSPDGSMIAYLRTCEVRMISPDGLNDRSVVDLSGVDPRAAECDGAVDLAWSPDGTQIAVVVDRDVTDPVIPSRRNVFLVQVADGDAHAFLDHWVDASLFWSLTWRPVP